MKITIHKNKRTKALKIKRNSTLLIWAAIRKEKCYANLC